MSNDSKKTVRVKLADIKVNLFVREALDQNHALSLAEHIAEGVIMPPMMVTPDLRLIDGRHRMEAYELNGIKEVDVEIVNPADMLEMIALAYKSNLGGSLPPTMRDTEHTVSLMLEHNASKKLIAEKLMLPLGLARKYIATVQSKITRMKLIKATSAITEQGLTVAKAAEQFDVDPERLKETISGHKRKGKTGIADVQRTITRTFKSVSQKNAALLRGLIDQFTDGDISEKQLKEIFTHVESCQKKSTRSVSEWKKRFLATVDGPGKSQS